MFDAGSLGKRVQADSRMLFMFSLAKVAKMTVGEVPVEKLSPPPPWASADAPSILAKSRSTADAGECSTMLPSSPATLSSAVRCSP